MFEGHADDAVTVAPQLHQVIFEDDKVRVLKVTVPSGAVAAMHWHSRNINYIQAGGVLRFNRADGSSADVTLAADQVTSSPAGSHAVENIGTTEVRTIQVEFKQAPTIPARGAI